VAVESQALSAKDKITPASANWTARERPHRLSDTG
jgi:hypothetical protein